MANSRLTLVLFTLPSMCTGLSFGVLAEKMKMREVSSLRETMTESAKALLESEEPHPSRNKNIAAEFASKKALGVIAEYHRNVRRMNIEEYEIPEVGLVSRETREAGAGALALNMDAGCSVQDFSEALAEQKSAENDFPGPLPMIWMDRIVDEVQLAIATDSGADAVTAYDADLAKLAKEKYGLEVFRVCRPSDLEQTTEDDTVLLVGYESLEQALELRSKIKGVAILKIEAQPGQGLEEAEEAWQARDAGYDAVWLSDVLYKFGAFSGKLFSAAPDTITSVIKAVKSKASANYARASGKFSGRGEGSKEYLGDILM